MDIFRTTTQTTKTTCRVVNVVLVVVDIIRTTTQTTYTTCRVVNVVPVVVEIFRTTTQTTYTTCRVVNVVLVVVYIFDDNVDDSAAALWRLHLPQAWVNGRFVVHLQQYDK